MERPGCCVARRTAGEEQGGHEQRGRGEVEGAGRQHAALEADSRAADAQVWQFQSSGPPGGDQTRVSRFEHARNRVCAHGSEAAAAAADGGATTGGKAQRDESMNNA